MRRKFLFGIFGALGMARAQELTFVPPKNPQQPYCLDVKNDIGWWIPCPPEWVNGPAKNGQCPVCGTQLPKIKQDYINWPKNCKPVPDPNHPGFSNAVSCEEDKRPQVPPTVVRCPRCSNAFWQDAE